MTDAVAPALRQREPLEEAGLAFRPNGLRWPEVGELAASLRSKADGHPELV